MRARLTIQEGLVLKGSVFRTSETPKRQVGAPVVVPIAVDAEAIGTEIADAHAEAVRVEI